MKKLIVITLVMCCAVSYIYAKSYGGVPQASPGIISSLPISGGTMTGNIVMGGNDLTAAGNITTTNLTVSGAIVGATVVTGGTFTAHSTSVFKGRVDVGTNDLNAVLGITHIAGTESSILIHNSLTGTDTMQFTATGGGDARIIMKDNNGNSDIEFRADNASYIMDSLGIGTNAPLDLAHLSSGAAATTMRIANNATDGDSDIHFIAVGTDEWTIGLNDGDSQKFQISDANGFGSARFSIDQSGNSSFENNPTTNVASIAHTTGPVVEYDESTGRLNFNNTNAVTYFIQF